MKFIVEPNSITTCMEKNNWTEEFLAEKVEITIDQLRIFNAGGEFPHSNKAIVRLATFLNEHCLDE